LDRRELYERLRLDMKTSYQARKTWIGIDKKSPSGEGVYEDKINEVTMNLLSKDLLTQNKPFGNKGNIFLSQYKDVL
jgi:hypothetical protein